MVELAVGLHVDASPVLEALTGDRSAFLPPGSLGDGELCDAMVVDADGDGNIEVLAHSVKDGTVTFTGCTSTREGEWVCEDTTLELSRDDGLYCGQTDHFRPVAGGQGIHSTVRTDDGRTVHTGTWLWDGSGFTPGTPTELASGAIFGVVLGLNNTKKEPAVPIAAMLSVVPNGGSWSGIHQSGNEVKEWGRVWS